MMERYQKGQKVKAKIQLENDLRDDGMGIELCAKQGDILIIRGVREKWYAVSHEHITDRAFNASHDELEPV